MASTEAEFRDTEPLQDGDPVESPQDSAQDPAVPGRPWRRRLCVRVVLVGYIGVLFWLALVGRRLEPTVQIEDLLQLVDWAVGVLVGSVLAAAQLLVLGFLVAFALGSPNVGRPVLTWFGRWPLAVLLGMGLFVLLSIAGSGRPPTIVSSVLPLVGYLVGLWIGLTCLRGRRAILWLVPKLGLLLLAFGLGIVAIVLLAIDEDPLAFQPPEVTSAEKRRVTAVIKQSSETAEGFRRIRLSGRDVNLLLAVVMRQAFPDGKARISLDRGTLSGESSIRISGISALPSYVNVHATFGVEITEGRPEVELQRCRIGRLSVPRFLLDDVWPMLISALLNDPDVQHAVASVDSLRIEPDLVEAVIESKGLRGGVIPSLLARLGGNPDVLPSVRIHYRHLVETAETLPGDDRFAGFVQAAFSLARQRSESEDPVLENRSAILALAILLGHWRVETLVGPVADRKLHLAARRHTGRVTLRNRRDWTRHFFVSAALALLSSEFFSDEVGLFKEELDAGEGGSGFSFSDLLADRAGTLFALAATRDRPAARAMQQRLADGFEIDAIFPQAADLPEGIPDLQLQNEYGGVAGKKYDEITREIERRLANCAALR
ncbi:MAG: hypothetical protein V3R99_06475 [Thermoguttaceae bacterium]